MDTTNLVAIGAALAAWVGLYIQWRSMKMTERDFQLRLGEMRNLIEKIDTETKTRQAEIEGRIREEQRLHEQHLFRQIEHRGVKNELILLDQILFGQLVVLMYLSVQRNIDDVDDKLGSECTRFLSSALNYFQCNNRLHIHLSDAAKMNAIDDSRFQGLLQANKETVKERSQSHTAAVSAAFELLRLLLDHSGAELPGGERLDESCLRQAREVFQPVEPIFQELVRSGALPENLA